MCAEEVKAAAVICRFCRHQFETASAPDAELPAVPVEPPPTAITSRLDPGEEVLVWGRCVRAIARHPGALAITSDRLLFVSDAHPDKPDHHLIDVNRTASVNDDLVSFKFDNDATYSYAGLDPSLAREIAATVVPASADRFFKDEAMLTSLRSRHDKINARTAALAPPSPPPRPADARTVRSSIETLAGRTRKHLQPSLGIDEEVRAVIKG